MHHDYEQFDSLLRVMVSQQLSYVVPTYRGAWIGQEFPNSIQTSSTEDRPYTICKRAVSKRYVPLFVLLIKI